MIQEQLTTSERRNQSQQIVEKMLQERSKMLVLLCKVSGLKPFDTETMPVKDSLQSFCEILVDYIASAHFGLYERIAEGKERRESVVKVAETTYPLISDSTQAAIEFNERYEKLDGATIKDHLQKDISMLGELLTTRIEYEDQLISAMMGDSTFTQEQLKA